MEANQFNFKTVGTMKYLPVKLYPMLIPSRADCAELLKPPALLITKECGTLEMK